MNEIDMTEVRWIDLVSEESEADTEAAEIRRLRFFAWIILPILLWAIILYGVGHFYSFMEKLL